jgi:DNA-binding NarL/FixJ family response regulator
MPAIVAAADESSRNRVRERLLEAGYDDPEVANLPNALAALLRESDQPVVVLGGTWPAPQPFLRVAVNAGALPLVLLEPSPLEAEGEALAMGAHAALQFDIPTESLAAALAAVGAGLIVLQPSARAMLLSAHRGSQSRADSINAALTRASDDFRPPNHMAPGFRPPNHTTAGLRPRSHTSDDLPPRRIGRPLTTREREILALVASGTPNKGIARALSVSANTVKFHLAAVFDKLNAGTRAEAVAEAIRRGELSI